MTTPIDKAIAAADEAIRKAANEGSHQNHSNAEHTGDLKPAEASSSAPPSPPPDDPDDLAAAFFAQQAKKEEMERTLPVEEWVKLFPNLRLASEPEAVGSPALQSSDLDEFLEGLPTFRLTSLASELRSDLDGLDASHSARAECDAIVPMSTECTISSNQMRDLVRSYALTMAKHRIESAGLAKLLEDMRKADEAAAAARSVIKGILVEKLFEEFQRTRASGSGTTEKRASFST